MNSASQVLSLQSTHSHRHYERRPLVAEAWQQEAQWSFDSEAKATLAAIKRCLVAQSNAIVLLEDDCMELIKTTNLKDQVNVLESLGNQALVSRFFTSRDFAHMDRI